MFEKRSNKSFCRRKRGTIYITINHDIKKTKENNLQFGRH